MTILPLTLAIDTARTRLQLALLRADGRVDTDVTDIARGHAEIVIPAIAGLLARNGLAYGDLERVAALAGPGSFTGLRVGLSVARGLGLALGVPVIGVPTLLAMSLARPGGGDIILDAGRGEAYVQGFSAPGAPRSAPRLVDLDRALADAGRPAPDDWAIDIEKTVRFAACADPRVYPPEPAYIRPPDAKPQTRGRVARQ